jgi:GNAT superfamily N-acetyltransferase
MPNREHYPDLLRPMREDDLPGVLALQAACYPPAMQEPGAVVLARLRAAPASTLVALNDTAGVCAYVFAYPSRRGRITALHAGFVPAPDADTLYIHDLAVDPRVHGRGLGRRLAQALLDGARGRGLRHAALVAVLDARPFWESLGFAITDPGEGSGILASYPGTAVYMSRLLNA